MARVKGAARRRPARPAAAMPAESANSNRTRAAASGVWPVPTAPCRTRPAPTPPVPRRAARAAQPRSTPARPARPTAAAASAVLAGVKSAIRVAPMSNVSTTRMDRSASTGRVSSARTTAIAALSTPPAPALRANLTRTPVIRPRRIPGRPAARARALASAARVAAMPVRSVAPMRSASRPHPSARIRAGVCRLRRHRRLPGPHVPASGGMSSGRIV